MVELIEDPPGDRGPERFKLYLHILADPLEIKFVQCTIFMLEHFFDLKPTVLQISLNFLQSFGFHVLD